MSKRIVLLFSDTGGGHRSAAEAVREALLAQHGAEAHVTLVDVFKHYTAYPFNHFPAWYPQLIQHGLRVWGGGFHLTNGRLRAEALYAFTNPLLRCGLQRFIHDHPADAYVSVHPLLTAPALSALGPARPPVITVVTDLVSTHALWYRPQVDLCIVPTEAARACALHAHMPPEKIRVVGLPVSARFCAPVGDKATLRAQLGWGATRPVVLMVGGGDGLGPLGEMAHALAHAGLECEVAVVCGRNEPLRADLAARHWPIPVHVYGFVTNMPDLMRAADVLVSKAGPGTICEGLNAGLPLVLYSYLPGQETGNVRYVTEQGVGVFAPNARAVVAAVRHWLCAPGGNATQQASQMARRLARPTAAQDIARLIWQTAN